MEVKWIKICTEIFDDETIRLIEEMPEGDTVIVIWFKLLIQAGKINDCGLVYFKKDIPFTDEMLATVFRRPLNIIRMALQVFEKFGMVEIYDTQGIFISNWEKHQNIDKLAEIREKGRLRNIKYRESKRQELLTCDVTDASRDALDIDKELDIDNISPNGDSRQEIVDPKNKKVSYNEFVSFFNIECPSLPSVKEINDTRKSKIRTRWKEHPDINYWINVFKEIEASDFLTGRNGKWHNCNIDWIIANNNNYTKVLEGTYKNKKALNIGNKEQNSSAPSYYKPKPTDKNSLYGAQE